MVIDTNPKKIEELLGRGVEDIIEKKHLEKRLFSGEQLRVKFGIDPTSPNIHIGHAIIFLKLKQFQELGHKIVFILGDFTAQIGDPTGRLSIRKTLSEQDIKKNMKTYIKQISKILDMEKTEIIYNSQHLSKMSFAEFYRILHLFTVNQILERDMFQERIKKEKPIWMHEVFYPMLQSYDSVIIKSDIEIGGTDQLFNMLAARTLQPYYDQKPQDVMTIKLLVGTDGKKKMSKSYDNYIGITELPQEQYGKIMSIPDDLICHYFELLTNISLKDIGQIKKDIELSKVNPKDIKSRLAKEVVALYHTKKDAEKAEQEFNRIFQQKKIPEQIPEVKIKEKEMNILDLLVKIKLAVSKAEAKRLVIQNGIKIDKEVYNDWQGSVEIKKGMIFQRGKRGFAKIG